MHPTKSMTIRLSSDQAEQLETVASIDGQPIAAIVRAAIEQHIEARRKDQKFQRDLKDRLSRTKRMLSD